MEVEHPAAKVLVELAELQDSEVGDGTTSVVIVAAEQLKRGTELVKSGIHPTTIMTGFRLALKDAVRFVKSSLMVPVCQLGDDAVQECANFWQPPDHTMGGVRIRPEIVFESLSWD